MKYVNVYETTDKFDFYKVVECLEQNHIDFQKLYEYRLHASSNYGSWGEPAFLRVKEYEATRVKKILEEKCLKKEEQEIIKLKDVSQLNIDLFKTEIQSVIGRKIEKVHYIFENEFDYNLDSIHSVDFGIALQLENGNYLSWQYEEADIDFEMNTYIPHRYELKFINILENIDKFLEVIDVTENEYWNRLLNKPITDIKIFTQTALSTELLTDLLIEIGTEKVAFFSSDPPSEDKGQIEVDLSIGINWTLVVFDKKTIEMSERIKE